MTTTHNIIAFQGEVEMEKAVWDTDWGMYVVLKLDQKPQDKNNANPFKKFTKMRKGKVGTRFDAVFNCGEDHIVYEDEVMLKGWSDGTTGWKVTLWLNADDSGMHPFMNDVKGQPYALALVELDEDQTPVNQVKRERLTRAEARKKYPLAMLAGQLCKNPQFWDFMEEKMHWPKGLDGDRDEYAKKFILNTCGIDSRRRLDDNPNAAETFHNSIRKPYLVWLGEGD